MRETITVRPDKARLINLLEDINKGRIKIPLFQREFVWKDKQMVDLFDSMEKGYPIGSLLFWKPEEKFKFYENFGQYIIDEKSNDLKYVLDGFQRLSTLFGVLSNPHRNHHRIHPTAYRSYSIYYDLEEEEFTYSKKKKDVTHIPLYMLVDTFDFLSFIDQLRRDVKDEAQCNELIDNAKKIAKTFVDYEIPFIDIKGGDITSSVDIFSRINSTGTRISTDWMVSALSYNPNEGFLFSEKIGSFLIELEEYNFEGLSRETILHCIECSTNKAYFDVKAEDLARKTNFPELVVATLSNIKKVVRFLQTRLNVLEYRLLPYNSQLIFLCEFFRLNPNPTAYQERKIIEWFWVTSYSNYFTAYSALSKQRQALAQFKQFALGKSEFPLYQHDMGQIFSTYPFPIKIDFGGVRSKALILFMLSTLYEYGSNSFASNIGTLDLRYLIPERKETASIVVFKKEVVNVPNEFISKKMDGSFIFSTEKDLSNYFLNDEMLRYNQEGRVEEFLERRLFLIRAKEREFVENLGVNYSFEEIN